MEELDTVVLIHDLEQHGLKKGDIGAIVHVHCDNEAYEVEFVSGNGDTITVITLNANEVRPIAAQEILHVREIA